ncbi:MAG: hypothetical protein A2249_03865 [Candidatus Jacksonbacteria bacterium RIFOXYA2_FULL_44_7]|uniref:HicB-like antitoxin of toxin-antitoxin system domain-containing protein n=1 Tax=Candidatus Jacksonbacteria bacterium RIFCSPLOWO2_02_FULL_44_20 TaxID=1798460 RepID=A0A1G2A9D5_9BACT|nr:MAG: hypothetical protein UW39_C0006G0017 [Parcubacteria group bacterium GW2011_GWC2_44_17]KKT50552.1 MAG: hypothetical protein UW40_C0002G0012 [Parcubacteria group bacterium GW2011_GWF2_44_17]OGY70972.1 MAG: hypothetical protein A3C00_02435 [Candidatus Jacksonbacteria bacterium RIFCSPHIGHO2_02_FULL_44_25]OGY71133.1 MAG: hypothetical protein A3E05_04155 [Candidatus Jacksonbacteria bacterium RIFCSPHIGHO2_12_FULL_44_12]OGY72677.1 MAG: hypothetical protein A3H61_01645 [Candidatus Jacksonbacteri
MEQKVEIYPISIEPMAEGGYFAECSLLQGCHAEGETFTEAINNLQDVIRVHKKCDIEFKNYAKNYHHDKVKIYN